MDIRITKARISFAGGLWKKSSAVENGTPKHNCDYIICPDSIVQEKIGPGPRDWGPATNIKALEKKVALEALKGDKKKADLWFDALDARQRNIREGNRQLDKLGEVREGYSDKWYVHATSTRRMPVYNADTSTVDSEDSSPIYSGCRVTARVSLYANLKPGAKGVFASIQGTQFHSEDDSFGGGRAAGAADFEPAEGAAAGDFGADLA
jgi:hypothetical protein